ncbi:MAG: FliM/FliN family flagellar motor C-terminal domain-containing protein [Acidobacteriaceae bacterium]
MGPKSENSLTVATAGETALAASPGQGLAGILGGGMDSAHDEPLGHLEMQLDVMVKAPSFCVRDLLALETGTVVETDHDHTHDVPVWCGGALLAWAEFEVVNERLAVRLTRLA